MTSDLFNLFKKSNIADAGIKFVSFKLGGGF